MASGIAVAGFELAAVAAVHQRSTLAVAMVERAEGNATTGFEATFGKGSMASFTAIARILVAARIVGIVGASLVEPEVTVRTNPVTKFTGLLESKIGSIARRYLSFGFDEYFAP